MRRAVLIMLVVLLPLWSIGKAPGSGNLTIVIHPVFNGQPLELEKRQYVNEHGDSLFIDLFRFYLTNIQLKGDILVTRPIFKKSDRLFDAEDTSTYTITLTGVPSEHYNTLMFLLGVDSIDNTSGANAGDLDPARGMYWAWNSGYIMAKIEGRSAVCKTLHHAFEFHIGGYTSPYNAARHITLQLPKEAIVGAGSTPVIHINADVAAWFSGNTDLTKINSILIPGKDACTVADRYARMFTVTRVE